MAVVWNTVAHGNKLESCCFFVAQNTAAAARHHSDDRLKELINRSQVWRIKEWVIIVECYILKEQVKTATD